MEKIFADEIKENGRVDCTFLVKQKSSALTKAGKPYLNLILTDKTGNIEVGYGSRLSPSLSFLKRMISSG